MGRTLGAVTGSVTVHGVANLAPFTPKKEARFFWRLYSRGRITKEQAARDLLMTPEELDEIISERLADKTTALHLFELRQQAYEMFERMVANPPREVRI